MLRFRLFFGLLSVIILLWSVGAAAYLLMYQTVTRFDKELRVEYHMISSAHTIRSLLFSLNSRFFPVLTESVAPEMRDREAFDRLSRQLRSEVASLPPHSPINPRWDPIVHGIDDDLNALLEECETFLGTPVSSEVVRIQLLNSLLTRTRAITDSAEQIVKLSEEQLFSGVDRFNEESQTNALFVASAVLLGTSVAGLIYFQLIRHVVDPMVALRKSIEEVRRGNFQQALPVPKAHGEFHQLVKAFNEMASELRFRRSESDDHLMRANMINRAILEAIPSPVFVIGDDSGLIQINPAGERLCSSLGAVGRIPLKIRRIVDDCRNSNTHFMPEDPREALLFRIEEQEYYYLPRIFRFDPENLSEPGWAVLLHNVSRIRWLDDMKTNLLSTVSHEIKTPLTGIRMVLHLLLEERTGPLLNNQRTMVTSANEDCERLLATLNNLLDLSRAESGATQLACVATSLKVCVARAAQLFMGAAAARKIEIIIEEEPGIPDVLADPLRLDEVLNNLVSNAIKFSPEKGVIRIRISNPDRSYCRVSVVDQGAGVPEASQSRIFERFYQVPGGSAGGVGLGLFICREIMRAHEGRIGLSERRGNVTEFYVDVPVARNGVPTTG